MCTYPFAKKRLRSIYRAAKVVSAILAVIITSNPVLCQNSALLKDHGCNLMHRKVLASFYQHLMAEAPTDQLHGVSLVVGSLG